MQVQETTPPSDNKIAVLVAENNEPGLDKLDEKLKSNVNELDNKKLLKKQLENENKTSGALDLEDRSAAISEIGTLSDNAALVKLTEKVKNLERVMKSGKNLIDQDSELEQLNVTKTVFATINVERPLLDQAVKQKPSKIKKAKKLIKKEQEDKKQVHMAQIDAIEKATKIKPLKTVIKKKNDIKRVEKIDLNTKKVKVIEKTTTFTFDETTEQLSEETTEDVEIKEETTIAVKKFKMMKMPKMKKMFIG